MPPLLRWIAAALIAALGPPVLAAPLPSLTGQASVIDADTIEIRSQRVRLNGIDAPESNQICFDARGNKWRCGQKASLALADLIGRSHVSCRISGLDKYDRQIGTCSVGGTDINQWLVRAGWALAYRKYSRAYVPDEQAAERDRAGIWQGRFVAPSDWRRGQRLNGSAYGETGPNGCAIKGNISAKGKRIYHLPGSRWHARTRIDASKGERWFCTELQARTAGWRKAGTS